MRKILIPLAAAASTMAFAATASAQWHPQPHPYAAPYASPHVQNNYVGVQGMHARAQNLRMHIRALDRRNLLTRNQARSLEREARSIEQRVIRNARRGLNVRERRNIELRLVRLEQRVQQQVAMNMRRGNHYGYGYGRR